MGRVDGKVAIVTGGVSGLGAADWRLFDEEGASVVLTEIDEEVGRAVAAEIGAEFIRQDVADEATWPALVDPVVGRHGGLDVLANNAARIAIGLGEPNDVDLEELRGRRVEIVGEPVTVLELVQDLA